MELCVKKNSIKSNIFLLRYNWHTILGIPHNDSIIIYIVNNHHNKSSWHSSPYVVTNFFPVIRTFKIYSPRNFQIYNTVLLTIVTMLCITFPWLIYFITGSLYLLTPFNVLIKYFNILYWYSKLWITYYRQLVWKKFWKRENNMNYCHQGKLPVGDVW